MLLKFNKEATIFISTTMPAILIYYVRRNEFLDSQTFGTIPVDGQAMRITVIGKSRTSVRGPWKMRISE